MTCDYRKVALYTCAIFHTTRKKKRKEHLNVFSERTIEFIVKLTNLFSANNSARARALYIIFPLKVAFYLYRTRKENTFGLSIKLRALTSPRGESERSGAALQFPRE